MSTATVKCFGNPSSFKSIAFTCSIPFTAEWKKKKSLFTPRVINCDMLIWKNIEITVKKTTVCSAFCMSFTFPPISDLWYALSRQNVINNYKIWLPSSSTPWWKAFTSLTLHKGWALLLSLSFLCIFREEKDWIICSNELTWRHKQQESLCEGLKFCHTLGT